MTRRYARISNRVVADEYNAVSGKVEAIYRDPALPAEAEGPNMRRLRAEIHHRLLGNGWCQRPAVLDCHFESICETCTHFATDATFQPVLLRQRDHAADNQQDARAALFGRLLDGLEQVDPMTGALRPRELRSLDAIHLATAERLRDAVVELIVYDERMAAVARQLGYRVSAPE